MIDYQLSKGIKMLCYMSFGECALKFVTGFVT